MNSGSTSRDLVHSTRFIAIAGSALFSAYVLAASAAFLLGLLSERQSRVVKAEEAPASLALTALLVFLVGYSVNSWSSFFGHKIFLIFFSALKATAVIVALVLLSQEQLLTDGFVPAALGFVFVLGALTALERGTRLSLLSLSYDESAVGAAAGYLTTASALGVIAGLLTGGLAVDGVLDPGNFGSNRWLLPAGAMLSFLAACFVRRPSKYVANDRADTVANPNVDTAGGNLAALICLVLLWGLGLWFLVLSVDFASLRLGLHATELIPWVVCFVTGLALGGWLAGKASIGGVEPALALYGFAGWSAIAALLALVALWVRIVGGDAATDGRSIAEVWPLGVGMALAGIAVALAAVALESWLLARPALKQRQTLLASANLCAGAFGFLMLVGFRRIANGAMALHDLDFALLAVVGVLLAHRVLRAFPQYFIRLTVTLLTCATYRIRLIGLENVPPTGPALLVFNHRSYADGNVIVASFKRFIRFVHFQGHYDNPLLRWMGNAMQSIPIDADGPRGNIARSLRAASVALTRGELVAIFPEGGISRVGSLLPFQRGMELIMRRAPDAPVVPACIDGLWGSIFSFQSGRFFKKWPKRLPYPVTIRFGKPMPAHSNANDVRDQVLLLQAESFDGHKEFTKPLHRQFIASARRWPRRKCMVDSTTPAMNFGTALIRSVALRGILSRQLGPEQYVGVLLPPSVGGALTNVALSFLGKVPVNLNYTVGVDVIESCMRQCQIKQVITSRRFVEKTNLRPNVELLYLEDLRPTVKLSDKLTGLAARFLPVWFVEHVLPGLGKHSMDDLATIIFSSGSTGEPKGVMLTHHNISTNIESVTQMVDATEHDVLLGVLPLFHSFGYTVTLWLPLKIGPAAVYHFNPLEAETIGNLSKEHHATVFVSTATFLRNYIRKCEPDDFKSLRILVCGAEKLPMQVADQFEKKFGVRPLEGYGCTELSPAVAANRPDWDSGTGYKQQAHKPGSIGHPMPGMAVRIVEPATWEPLPIGQEGMLLVKGPNVMKGYLNRPEQTAEVIRDGWYATGDIAKLDEDGFITITDRLSRFSKIGGEMVPHGKIEDVIHEILETHERLCIVVGVPDERKGERLVVVHTPLPISVEKLWVSLRDRGLPPLWVPAKHAFFEISELPILGSGKIDLKAAKKIAHEKLGHDT